MRVAAPSGHRSHFSLPLSRARVDAAARSADRAGESATSVGGGNHPEPGATGVRGKRLPHFCQPFRSPNGKAAEDNGNFLLVTRFRWCYCADLRRAVRSAP